MFVMWYDAYQVVITCCFNNRKWHTSGPDAY